MKPRSAFCTNNGIRHEGGVKIEPFTLTYEGAEAYFGFAAKTLRNLVSKGELLRGKHYLKIGRKVLILREGLTQWLFEKDGVNAGGFNAS